MLSALRKSAGSWMIKVLLGMLVAAFVLVGTGSYRAYRSSKIVTVNGKSIPFSQYETVYNNIMDSLRNRLGNKLNDALLKKLDVKKQALDQIIETELIRQAAEKNGIEVANKELAEAISQIPAFQDNGRFSNRRYKQLLSMKRMTPESFENMEKEAMLLDKLRSIVTSCAMVSNDEAKQWYTWENTAVSVDFVVFSPDSYKDVKISDAMLKDYYSAHKEEYKTPPTRKVRYVKFAPEQYKEKVNIPEDTIHEYYLEHEDNYPVKEKVTARQILLKLPQKATTNETEKRRQEALKILEELKSGKDFTGLVKKYSESPDKKDGGLIGPFTRDEIVKPIADKLFSMEVGQISDPVRTSHGWVILKLESKTPAGTLPFKDVSDKIKNKLVNRKEKSMAYDDALSLYDSSISGDDLIKNAPTEHRKVVTTDFFAKAKGPSGIEASDKFAKIAFNLDPMEISDVEEIGDAYYLIQVIDDKPSQIPPLDAVKDKVLADVTREQQEKTAENAAKQFLKKIKEKGSIAAAAEGSDLKVQSATIANRNSAPPAALGKDENVQEAAFNLSEQNRTPENPIKGGDKYYVLELKKRTEPPPAGFNAVKSVIIKRLTYQKQSELFTAWIDNLKKNSVIKDYSSRFFNKS